MGRCNCLIAREVAILVLIGEVILARTDDERLDRLAFRIDRLNHCNPFPVSRLHWFRLWMPFCTCDNYSACNYTHKKASLVKVIDIIWLDAVLRDCIRHKPKLIADNRWIFALGSLVVVFTKEMRLKVWVLLHEVMSLMLANWWRVAVGK